MGGWSSNISQAIRDVIPDEGIWQDLPGWDITKFREEAGNIVTTSTTPVLVLTSDVVSVSWAASNVDAAYLIGQVPRSLATLPSKTAAVRNIPFPRLRLILSMLQATDNTDTPGLTVTAKARAFDGAVKATFTSNFLASQPLPGGGSSAATNVITNQTNPKAYVYDFWEVYGTGPVYIEPGDSLHIKIVPGTHGNNAVSCHGLILQAACNMAYTDKRLRV